MDVGLVELRVAQRPLDRVHRAAEEVCVQLLETRASDRRVEIDALKISSLNCQFLNIYFGVLHFGFFISLFL